MLIASHIKVGYKMKEIYNLNSLSHVELQSCKSGKKFSHSAVLTELLGFKHIFVHHEILPPGRRASEAHRHSQQEEMVLVLKGSIVANFDTRKVTLSQGDFIGFSPDSHEMHFIENTTNLDAEFLVIASKPERDDVIYEIKVE